MARQQVVIPAKAGIQVFCNAWKKLDSGLRRNDGFGRFWTCCIHHLRNPRIFCLFA